MFKEIEGTDSIKEVIKTAFSTDLEVEGAWGYRKEESTMVGKSHSSEKSQTEFMLATMRAYLEMNMTLGEEERYGAINLTELSREVVDDTYNRVVYEVSAIKESAYKEFIEEYKANSGESDFDMSDHFARRKEATLKREVIYWFKWEE